MYDSKELNALLESKRLKAERAVLVCSEKLPEELWVEIESGCLLCVYQHLKPEVVKVN